MPWRLPLSRSGASRPRHARAGAGAARGSGWLRSSLARLSAPRPDERQAGTGKRRFSRTRKQRVGRAAGGQITRYKRRTSLRVTDSGTAARRHLTVACFAFRVDGPRPSRVLARIQSQRKKGGTENTELSSWHQTTRVITHAG